MERKNIVYDLDSPEAKVALANGAKVNYLGKEHIYSQPIRIVTVLIGLIIGFIIFSIIGSLIFGAIAYWIANEKRDMYFIDYP